MVKEVKGTEGEVKAAIINPNAISFGEVRVENTLKFKPRPELGNLCTGKLIKVEIVESLIPKFNEETGIENTWEYAGFTVPRLELTFSQTPTTADPRERIYKQEYKVITSVGKEGNEIDPKTLMNLYTSMFAHIKHITNAYKGLANYSEAVADVNSISIDPSASVEDRIVAFRGFLGYFVALLNGKDGKGCYAGTELWLKLVADYRSGKFLCFPTFVGEGFVERVIAKRNPAIEFKAGETIELVAGKTKGKSAAKGAGAAGAGEEGVDDDVDALLKKYN